MKRGYLVLALLALLAVMTIQSRPIGVAVFGVQPALSDIQIVGTADGGHICKVTSNCQTVTPTHLGMDIDHLGLLFLAAAAVLLLLLAAASMQPMLFLSVINPPPQSLSFA